MTAFVLDFQIRYLLNGESILQKPELYLFERRKPSEKGAEGAISALRADGLSEVYPSRG